MLQSAPPPSTMTHTPPQPLDEGAIDRWMLDPAVTFLNHGSYGARPKAVHAARLKWLQRIEAEPLLELDRIRPQLVAAAKVAAGACVNARPENFGFVTNASAGVCAVLRSMPMEPGDELLTTTHVYPGVRETMKYLAAQRGGVMKEAHVPLPVHGPDDFIAAIDNAITDRTRLVLIDHIASPTAIVFPVQAIVDLCHRRGVEILVDGAHSPGMLPLDIESTGATYYVSNFHKWICAPMGAGMLWVTPDKRESIRPAVISNFNADGFVPAFEWQGTRDITPWLTVPDAIAWGASIGWDRIMQHNHELAVWVQDMLCSRWDVEPNSARDGSMIGSMASITLPAEVQQRYNDRQAYQAMIHREYNIEAPIVDWPQGWLVRPSCQIYNRPEQYIALAEAIEDTIA
jgi:isopenicillin-N epimerase